MTATTTPVLRALVLAAALAGGRAAAQAPAPDAAGATPPPTAQPAAAATTPGAAAAGANDAAAPGTSPPAASEGAKRVPYIPEPVRAQLKEELKAEILSQAREERWAAPNAIPAWIQRLKLEADVRTRYEAAAFQDGNDASGVFYDFNAINTGKPFDLRGVDLTADRYLNVDGDRNRARLRARVGIASEVGEGFTGALRLASGDNSAPVSTNQVLGGGGGNFSKYALWLDRAWVRYQAGAEQGRWFGATLGRMDNPFFATDLVWDDDLGFDGLTLQARLPVAAGVTPFVTVGGFPLYSTAFDFAADQPSKRGSFDKWLFGAQLGAEWKPAEGWGLKLGGAFYHFDNVQGHTSSPCATNTKDVTCDTDASRPSFAQKGNSYTTLRTPSEQALLAESAGGAQYQYFGLASEFQVVALTGRLEVTPSPAVRIAFEGELVRNVALSRARMDRLVVNNLECTKSGPNACSFDGGNSGYLGRLTVGSGGPRKRGSWSLAATYRFVESDAVVDAFTDSDFGLGGTNLQGFSVAGSLALSENVTAGARWFSANEVTGPKYGVDVFHVDISTRF